jgi:hypothetical protein
MLSRNRSWWTRSLRTLGGFITGRAGHLGDQPVVTPPQIIGCSLVLAPRDLSVGPRRSERGSPKGEVKHATEGSQVIHWCFLPEVRIGQLPAHVD